MASVISITAAIESAEQQLCAVLDGVSSNPCNGIVLLDIPVEWIRYCEVCQRQQLFVATRVCVSGMIGKCAGGDDRCLRCVPFSRTTSEAA